MSRECRVRDVMGPALVVPEHATLAEVASVMLRHNVQAVLVVDGDSRVRGAVTDHHLTLDSRCVRMTRVAARELTARDVMQHELTSVDADEPLHITVDRMLRREADLAVVRDGDTVLGVLGRADLVRRVAGAAPRVDCAPIHPLKTGPLMRSGNSVVRWLVGAGR